MSSSIDSDEGYLLVIVLDVHPCLASNEKEAIMYLNAVTAFANLHLASSGANRLAIIAANHAQTYYLYPDQSEREVERQCDGRLELLSNVDKTLQENLKKMMLSTTIFTQSESLIAGALGRSLLYIRRQEVEDAIKKKINARILVIKISSDAGGQYLNYVNMYLTAQKMRIPIDMCVIGSDCGLLQQGADITGGLYLKVNSVDKLMETLLMVFTGDLEARRKIALPPSGSVDYRAACFCHRSLVDMAHVCSNCLSVYCKAVPLCSTCNALFGMEMPKLRKPIKKKKNDN